MLLLFLMFAAAVGYFVYQQYLTPAGNQPSTTTTDPLYPSRTPKPAASSASLSKDVDASKFVKSSSSKTPLVPPSPAKKSRTPRPIQVITLGIGGDDLAPGVVKEAQPSAPVAPVEAAPAPVEAAPAPVDAAPTSAAPEQPKAEEPPKVEEAPKPAPEAPSVDANNNAVAAPEVKKPEESSGPVANTAQEPSDVTQDSGADAKKPVVQTPTLDVITAVSPAPAEALPVVSQSPTPDVITARSPAPADLPIAPTPEAAAAAPPAPAAADDQKPSEDVKTAQIPGENSTKESKSDGQSPATPVDANNNPVALGAGGSDREKAKDADGNNSASTQSAPPAPVDPSAVGTDGKKKKKKKSRSGKKSKGEKSEDGEKKKKSKKRSKKSKDGKKKKSKKGSSGAEKESEKEAAAAPQATPEAGAPQPPPPADAGSQAPPTDAPPPPPAV